LLKVNQIKQLDPLSLFALSIQKSERPVRETRTREKKDVSQVVFFYHLPRESDKKMELLKIARRFGTVEKHLFVDKGVSYMQQFSENALLKSVLFHGSLFIILLFQ